MNNNDSHNKPTGTRRAPAFPTDDKAAQQEKREPVFSDFDEFEDFEESERDTDYAAAYEDDGDEDELLDDDDPDNLATEWQVIGGATKPGSGAAVQSRNPWAVEGDSASVESPDAELDAAQTLLQEDKELTRTDSADDWEDEDDYLEDEEDYDEEPEESSHGWPLGMIVVGIVALALLAAGGYGVIQQRAASAEEIRQLQATLATAANPAEVDATREALKAMEERNARNQATIDALTLENRRLTDTVAGFEKQLAAQKTGTAPVTTSPAAEPAAPKPVAKAAPKPRLEPVAKPVAKPVPAARPSSTAATGENWFVNFSSYTQRGAADSWVKKLQPSTGEAIVTSAVKDGRTFYRVRVVDLADRTQAEKVARELQSAHGVSALWVGKE